MATGQKPKKQYGVMFIAPLCKKHGEQMDLSVMRFPWGKYVEWYCPRDKAEGIDSCCEVRDATHLELPVELQNLFS